jgi:hypothetical protein
VYSDWYPDDDGDGYGVTDDPKNDCVAPSGYIAVGGDCDDKSSSTHPGATELCANGVDDDCDTDVDDCQIAVALADFMAVGSAWGWFGTDLDVADADADGVSDLLVGSFEDLALYVVYGPASGTTTTSSMVALRGDSTIPSFGSTIGSGDANDDRVDDVLAGSSHIDSIGTSYLFLGPITADRSTTDADAVLAGPTDSLAGCYLDVVGDFDGDGASDVAIGAPADTGVLATAYVATGPTSGAIDLAADAAYVYEGTSATDSDLGYVQRVGDMNADGIDELAVADWSGAGTVYLIDGGSAPGTYAVDVAASATLRGPERDSYFAGSTSVDYNADGTLDLVVGAAGADAPFSVNGGAVFAFLGPLSGSLDGRDAAAIWVPDPTVALLGNDVAVGDVDGDESPDLLFGAPWAAGYYDGEMFLQLGPASGVIDVTGLASFRGDYGEELGMSVAIVPDWTGDGRDEVATATIYHPDAAGDLIGALWVFDSETILGP